MRSLQLALVLMVTTIPVHATFAQDEPAWEQLAERDGIKTFGREIRGSAVKAFRGEATVDLPISRLYSVLRDKEERGKEWAAMLVDVATFRELGTNEWYVWQHYDQPWPISDRDFAFRARATMDKSNRVVTIDIKSVVDKDAPEQECCIRAEITRFSWRLTAKGPNQTFVEVDAMIDPKGSLPKWLVKSVQKNWAYDTITGLKKQAGKPDIKPWPELAAWQ